MVRVCRPGGRIGIIDMVVLPEPKAAREHNRLERLRDQTHTDALSLEGLVNLLSHLGVRIVRHTMQDVKLHLTPGSPQPRRLKSLRSRSELRCVQNSIAVPR